MAEEEKNWYTRPNRHPLIEIAFVFVCIYLLIHFAGPLVVGGTQNDLFTVMGTGNAKGTPSKATVSLTVTTKESSRKAATEALNTRVKTITSDLKKLGIADADIKTTNLQSYPQYDVSPVPFRGEIAPGALSSSDGAALPAIAPGSGKVSGWTASETIEVKAPSVELAQKALAAAQSDGADPAVNGVQFVFDDSAQKQLEQKARVAAINDAKSKAQELAKESGISLGRLVNVVENDSPVYQPMDLKSNTAGPAQAEPQLNPGQSSISKTVTLYYQTR